MQNLPQTLQNAMIVVADNLITLKKSGGSSDSPLPRRAEPHERDEASGNQEEECLLGIFQQPSNIDAVACAAAMRAGYRKDPFCRILALSWCCGPCCFFFPCSLLYHCLSQTRQAYDECITTFKDAQNDWPSAIQSNPQFNAWLAKINKGIRQTASSPILGGRAWGGERYDCRECISYLGANSQEVQDCMKTLYSKYIELTEAQVDPILIAEYTATFLFNIHPFHDGNNRTAEWLWLTILIQHDVAPPVLDTNKARSFASIAPYTLTGVEDHSTQAFFPCDSIKTWEALLKHTDPYTHKMHATHYTEACAKTRDALNRGQGALDLYLAAQKIHPNRHRPCPRATDKEEADREAWMDALQKPTL